MNYLVLINTMTGNYYIQLYYIDLTKKNLLTKNLSILKSNDINSITNLLKNIYSFFDIRFNYLTYYDEKPDIIELNIDDDKLIDIKSNIGNDKLIDFDDDIKGVSIEENDMGIKQIITKQPEINIKSYFIIIIQKNKLYKLNLGIENSLLRKIFHIYKENIKEIFFNKIYDKLDIDKNLFFKLTDDEIRIKELKYYDCDTFDNNITNFINILTDFNKDIEESKQIFFVNDVETIILKLNKKIKDYTKNNPESQRYNTFYKIETGMDINKQKYLENFIILNKDLWDFKINRRLSVHVHINKDFVFNNLFNNSIDLFNKYNINDITLTLNKSSLIGGNKYNKYTLKELKQLALDNKIKITKIVIISINELHKKLKDKDITINKKIKLEDFKRILIENNIKITKKVYLNKQELIKKLISK
jgi:hypothetical protein